MQRVIYNIYICKSVCVCAIFTGNGELAMECEEEKLYIEMLRKKETSKQQRQRIRKGSQRASRRRLEMDIITVRLVGVVVESAIQIAVALQLFGYAVRVVGAAEVHAFVAVVVDSGQHRRRLDLRPDGAEASTAGHFIGRREPVCLFLKNSVKNAV